MLRGEGGSCTDCQAHQPGTAAAGEGVGTGTSENG